MKFYIITMLDAPERAENVTRLISKFGGDFSLEVFPAIVPSNDPYEDKDYDCSYRTRNFGYHLSRGEIGCFKSHREIWKKIALGKEEIVGILEDDVILGDNFSEVIDLSLSWRNKWDICRLVQAFPQKLGVTIATDNVYRLRYTLMPCRGTMAYLVKKNAVRNLLSSSEKIRVPVDHYLDDYRRHELLVLDVTPPCAEIISSPSIIGNRGWDKNVSGKRSVYRLLQRDLYNFNEQSYRLFKMIKLYLAKLLQRS